MTKPDFVFTMINATLTEEEVGRLDRQIRVWGFEAQQRLVMHH
jgi:molybdopterin/thiamine biosynthesis adenylyltransferase